ncbi:hypothetical protein C8Q76DRAFT_616896 [Earliella scabrosa]|nr:hypothetical protein C8Q76DRAFT_616896 [Earliella scabrosa]
MSPAFSRLRSHDQETAHSYALLDAAREAARVSRGYDSVATRLKVTEEFRERMGGKSPHAWQLDVTEALLLGMMVPFGQKSPKRRLHENSWMNTRDHR